MRNKKQRIVQFVCIIAGTLILFMSLDFAGGGRFLEQTYVSKVVSAKAEMRIYGGCVMEYTTKVPLPTEDEGLNVIVKDHCVRKIEKDP